MRDPLKWKSIQVDQRLLCAAAIKPPSERRAPKHRRDLQID